MWIDNDNVLRGESKEWCWHEGIITLDGGLANETLDLTRDVWILFSKYSGIDLSITNKEHFNNAVIAQKNAIKCFGELNINGYNQNMTVAKNEYNQIDYY